MREIVAFRGAFNGFINNVYGACGKAILLLIESLVDVQAYLKLSKA